MKVQHTFKATATGFELKAQDGSTITISKEHKKYDWLANQEANRVINVYPNGKMTSSADYKGLYASSGTCLLYTSPSPRDTDKSRMPSSA